MKHRLPKSTRNIRRVSSSQAKSIHIVRRYGKVGGMERYVWELTHSLARAGHQVRVICCEQDHALELDPAEYGRIEVRFTGNIGSPKPRWIYQLRFRRRVDEMLTEMKVRDWVIHSHERSLRHHITTFHSASVRSTPPTLLDRISPRDRAWRRMEEMELNAPSVQKIFPVSYSMRETLAVLYPEVRVKLQDPAFPGVGSEFQPIERINEIKTIGFLGVEWQRKGLEPLVKAAHTLRAEDPDVRLLVAGCDAVSVQHLFHDWTDGYELLGWIDAPDFYRRIGLLALPASVEPFGMVAAEANACGLPVVVSKQCGIAPLIDSATGSVVDAGDIVGLAHACKNELARVEPPAALGLSWDNLATQYASAYSEVVARIAG